MTWSFLSERQATAFGGGAFTLANPISEELKVMRPSLLPGILSAAERNLRRGAGSVRLFEIGRRYLAEGERATLGLVLAGERAPRGWRRARRRRSTPMTPRRRRWRCWRRPVRRSTISR